MMGRRLCVGGAMLAIAVALACQGCGGSEPSSFNAARAWDDLVAQCDFGVRVPGTDGHVECGEWIETRLQEAGWHTRRDPFRGRLATIREERDMWNIIATQSPDAEPTIILTAHWDTRAIAERDPNPSNRESPILGANDGASGVAVLLEVARCLSEFPSSENVALILYDGEDNGVQGRLETWCLGSRHFAARTLRNLNWEISWGINVDMVGDSELQLRREALSQRLAPALTDNVWHLGQRRHPDVYLDEEREVYDDHVPLLTRGIPHIDIIDIEYSSWHTLSDTPTACSQGSLQIVGEVLLSAVMELDAMNR